MNDEYTVDLGLSDRVAWYEIMGRFQDANLYQAWSYDMVRYGPKSVVHMVLRRGDEPVAAAQARIARIPATRAGIAYVLWGPLWRRKGEAENEKVFRHAVRMLRSELSLKRGLVLRLNLLAFRGRHEVLRQILLDEGYHPHQDAPVKRTLIVDLTGSLEELRAAQVQKWRNRLNRAERNGLELAFGEDEALFDEITPIYRQMANRKGLTALSDIEHLKKVQRDLPPSLKLKIIVCREGGVACAGGIFAAIGATGLYLIGATSDLGMSTNGSYMVHWAFVKWLKENGFLYYDLNGINPETNPGTYHFKHGLAGRAGLEVEMLGKFQVVDSAMTSLVVRGGERLLAGYRKVSRRARSR